MLIPIICFTCGCSIGDKEDLYNYLKTEKIKKNHSENHIDDDLDCIEILEKIDIMNDCCKMHFISSMIFTDYY